MSDMDTIHPADTGTAVVLGLGASGQAAAGLLACRGWRVAAIDAASGPAQQDAASRLREQGVDARAGCEALPPGRFDLGVVSPGIAADSPWVEAAQHCCGEVVGELGLGARWLRAPMLAVTGTNGKSTAAKLCAEVLRAAGFEVLLGGNYGEPLCALVDASAGADWVVAEVSSFQLELPGRLHPRVGLYLNLQPDHLDRHGDLAAYRRIKARLFDHMTGSDTAVVQAAELAAVQACATGAPRWLAFGDPGDDFGVTADWRITIDGQDAGIALAGTGFGNPVLARMVAGATGACLAAGATPADVIVATRSFAPLPHRMECVASRGDVDYIDDSKATNLAALAAGVQMLDRPVRLIAGGRLKENDLDSVKEVLASRVRCVYVIGEAAGRMVAAWRDCVSVRECGDLERAVLAAQEDVQAGEAVLLSPGCASFDQFSNYKERGSKFRAIVEESR